MNVREKFESILVNMGLFESQAKEVMKLAIPELNDIVSNYGLSFNSPYDNYPPVIYNTLMMQIKPIALKWIEENKPEAWCKGMFE